MWGSFILHVSFYKKFYSENVGKVNKWGVFKLLSRSINLLLLSIYYFNLIFKF